MLAAVVPHLRGAPSSWRADDVAFATAWLLVVVCAAWLALTTLACVVALARGNHRGALRIAGCAPPFARRLLRAALVSAITLSPAAASAAAPAPPSAPLTLHVGPDGRLTTVPAAPAHDPEPATEVPVVRQPPPSTTTPRTTPLKTPPSTAAPTPRTTPTTPPPAAPPTAAPSLPAPTVAPVPVAHDHVHVVRAGDNLWRIAATELARVRRAAPTEADVARYWQRVIAANRTTLRSGDPSLIFPGEVVTLPLD